MSRGTDEQGSWVARLLDDWTLRFSALFFLAVILMPAEGFGFDLCPCLRLTHAPCPGCGMTRSGSNLVKGHLLRAIQYHPLGPVLIPIIGAFGLLSLAPRRWRQAVREAVARRAGLRWFYGLGVAGLITFGAVRWVCVFFGWTHFPAQWP